MSASIWRDSQGHDALKCETQEPRCQTGRRRTGAHAHGGYPAADESESCAVGEADSSEESERWTCEVRVDLLLLSSAGKHRASDQVERRGADEGRATDDDRCAKKCVTPVNRRLDSRGIGSHRWRYAFQYGARFYWYATASLPEARRSPAVIPMPAHISD